MKLNETKVVWFGSIQYSITKKRGAISGKIYYSVRNVVTQRIVGTYAKLSDLTKDGKSRKFERGW